MNSRRVKKAVVRTMAELILYFGCVILNYLIILHSNQMNLFDEIPTLLSPDLMHSAHRGSTG